MPDKIVCKDSRGRSPIFNACEKNNLSALKLLVEAGFDPDEEDREGWRPIQVAITNQTGEKHRDVWYNKEAEECVFHLLKSSAEVRRRTQAWEATMGVRYEISQGGIRIVLNHVRNVVFAIDDWALFDEIKNSESPQLQRSAVTKENHISIDPVLDSLVESLKKEAEGTSLSVISKAVEEGNAEQLDLLLQAGVSPDIGDSTGISPYQKAYQDKRGDICAKLVDAGADYKNIEINGKDTFLEAVQENKTKLAIAWIKAGAESGTRGSNGMRELIHIAAENSNWEILSRLLDSQEKLNADLNSKFNEDCHGASASCQSILVNLAKANQLQLLERLLEASGVSQYGIHHLVLNHWDVDCLLRLENPDLLPLVQKFASEKFARPPLENYTTGQERLAERLKMHNIEFRAPASIIINNGEYHDYQVRWNQPIQSMPTIPELRRQGIEEKILYKWEEKSAYEARGQITGIQVATDGEDIIRIRFAFKHIFEEWRATAITRGDNYWGKGGEEQDPFLLEEGERVVEVTTYTACNLYGLLGLELLTTSGRRVFWGKKIRKKFDTSENADCKKSVTKETFLAFCSGGYMVGFFSLTFHWEQYKPTSCV